MEGERALPEITFNGSFFFPLKKYFTLKKLPKKSSRNQDFIGLASNRPVTSEGSFLPEEDLRPQAAECPRPFVTTQLTLTVLGAASSAESHIGAFFFFFF